MAFQVLRITVLRLNSTSCHGSDIHTDAHILSSQYCAQESNVKVQKHIYPWIQMSLPQKRKWPTSYSLVGLMTRYVSQSTMLHIPLKTTHKLAENCAGVFPVYEGPPKSTSATKSHTKPPKPSKHQETHDHKLGHSESATQAYLLTITRGSLSKKKKAEV